MVRLADAPLLTQEQIKFLRENGYEYPWCPAQTLDALMQRDRLLDLEDENAEG